MKKKTVLIVCIACTMNMVLALNHSWSLFEAALHDAGWMHMSASLPVTVFSLCYSLLMTPAGLFIDKVGARIAIWTGAAIAGAGLVISGVTMTVPGVVIGFGVMYSCGICCCYAANIGNAMKWVPVEKRGSVTGVIISCLGISGIISSQVAGRIIVSSGIAQAFFTLAAYSTPVLMIGASFLTTPPKDIEAGKKSDKLPEKTDTVLAVENLTLKQTIRTKRFYLLTLTNLFGCMAHGCVSTFIVTIAKEQAGIPAETATIFVTVVAISNFAGRFSAGFVSDLFPRKYMLSVMFSLDVIVLLLFRYFTNGFLVGLGIVILTLTSASLMVMTPVLVTDYFGPKYYGQNYGLVNAFCIINGFVPAIMGSVIDNTGSFIVPYYIGAAFAAVTVVLTLLLPKTGGRKKKVKD